MARAFPASKYVDIIPHRTVSGDFRKVSEYASAEFNSIVAAVANILTMEEGTNQLFPGMGCREKLLSLINSSTTSAHLILEQVKDNLQQFIQHEVYLDYHVDPKDPEFLFIQVTIPGLPAVLLQVGPRSRYIRVVDQSVMGAA